MRNTNRLSYWSVGFVVLALVVASLAACDTGGQGVQGIQSNSLPVVAIMSPTSGARFTLGQEILVQASASDAAGVTRLELWANGVLLGGEDSPSPLSTFGATIRWVPSAPGQYTLEVRSINRQQQAAALTSVVIFVDQGIAPTPPPTNTPAAQPTPTTIQPTQTTCIPSLVVNRDLDMRAGPDNAYQAIGRIVAGGTAQITGRNADSSWWQVSFSKIQGWVPAADATPSCVGNVPIVSSPGVVPTMTSVPAINFQTDSTSINYGECTTLRWDVDNVRAISLSDGQNEGGVSGHSNTQVCPLSTTTYVLRVIRPDNREEWRQVTVEVRNAQRYIHLQSDHTNLRRGECTTLRWDVEGARRVYVDLGNGEQRTDSHSNSQICPTQTRTYTLRAEWSGGGYDSRQVTVSVNESGSPTIVTFGLDRRSVNKGECATLRWEVQNANVVRIQRLIPGGGWQQVSDSGSWQECPAETTTYRLRAEGSDGSTKDAEITLEVK